MFEALLAAFCIALLSLLGALFFGEHKATEDAHRYMLPAAVGVFLGIVFFDLIPETLAEAPTFGPLTIVAGFLGFYLLSHILEMFHHHHMHDDDTCLHHSVRMLLIGGAIHNVTDGIVIATAFMVAPAVGVLTTLGIALHEIPQEIAKFGILMKSGCTRARASLYNLTSASSVILGVLFTYLFSQTFTALTFVLTGIAAGNLLYIATADFIPELRHSHRDHFTQTFIATLMGVTLIGILTHYIHL